MNSISSILTTTPKDNREAVKVLCEGFKNAFGSRVVFLGLHGSSRHQSIHTNRYSDIDLELVLNVVRSNDLQTVAEVIRLTNDKVECQVRAISEITNLDSLIHQTRYKIFMYWAYANSITLLGENIYKKLVSEYSDEEYRESILLCVQLMWKDLRKKYLSEASPSELNKLIEVFLFDALLYCGGLDYRDLDKKKIFESKRYNVYEISAEYFRDYLTDDKDIQLRGYKNCHDDGSFDVKIIDSLQVVFDAVAARTVTHKS